MKAALALAALAALAVLLVAGGATARIEKRPVLRITVVGGGSVRTSDSHARRCSARCSTSYLRGRVFLLTATPADHYSFDHWEGACIGAAASCPVAVDRDTSVVARFTGAPVAVETTVGGPGRVTSSEGGLDCGEGGSACRIDVRFGSDVTLTPIPSGGGRFGGWDGPCASAGVGPCTLRVDRLYTDVAAAFGHGSPQQGPQTLTVQVDGAAYRNVTTSPPGIDCPPGATCSADFPSGTFVVLDSLGIKWLPPCRGTLARCALVVDEPTRVQSAAAPPPPPPPPPPPQPTGFLVTVSGGGLLTSSNGSIRCGWSPAPQTQCADDLPPEPGAKRLRAKTRASIRFSGWGGLCHGSKPRCTAHFGYGRVFSVTGLFRRR